MIWRKSSRSGSDVVESDCVEMAQLGESVGLRDSKRPALGALVLTRQAVVDLVNAIKSGRLDL